MIKPKPPYSPHEHFPINYGKHDATQYTIILNNKPILSPTGTKYIQPVTLIFLYYDRSLDAAMLPALNDISSQQAKTAATTQAKMERLMDYVDTYPYAYL